MRKLFKFFFCSFEAFLRFPESFLISVNVFQFFLLFLLICQNIFDRLSVFCLQPVKKIQTFLRFIEGLVVKGYILHIGGKFSVKVIEKPVDIPQSVPQSFQFRIIFCHPGKLTHSASDGVSRALIISGKAVDRLQCFHDQTAVAETAVKFFQFFIFSDTERRFFDFTDLKFQKSFLTVSLFLICIQFFQGLETFSVFMISLADLRFRRLGFLFSICVKDLQLSVRIQKGLMLMLPVDIQKAGCRRLHLAYCTGLAVDPVNTSSLKDLPGEQHLAFLRIDFKILKFFLHLLVLNLKQELYQRVGSSCADHIFCDPASQNQLHGTQKD